ncbi:MAG: GNAT family N-acetyltransferase [Dysgonomonas sp.]
MNDTPIEIRQEKATDYPAVYNVHTDAFGRKDEARLTDRLRLSDVFIPELSLVAICDNKLVGHIMFTEVSIVDDDKETTSLSLAPMAVIPVMQREGVGSLLVNAGLSKACELGYKSVIVLGHKDYYPRFGFEPTNKWGIKAPFNVPDPVFMGLELVKDAFSGVKGIVRYAREFQEI